MVAVCEGPRKVPRFACRGHGGFMSRPGRIFPALTKTLPVLIAAATLIPALPAAAAPEPPFQIEFPQETEPTEFTSSFGDGRSGGRRHTGNDLMAPKMTEVYAAAEGI